LKFGFAPVAAGYLSGNTNPVGSMEKLYGNTFFRLHAHETGDIAGANCKMSSYAPPRMLATNRIGAVTLHITPTQTLAGI
jgi:hypothetical protein